MCLPLCWAPSFNIFFILFYRLFLSPLIQPLYLFHCSDLDDPEGLAYDWINDRLYFTDYHTRNVQSMGVDGMNRSIIANADSPRGIIVDPCYG